jgi:putative ABC transport system ATP-binding protein
VITHNASIAGMADRVVKMRSGKITDIHRNERRLTPDEIDW